jgi:dipeptidyl-peptidase-4
MALYAMTHSDRFIAGCAGSPVADWRLYDATYVERFMGLVSENKVGYDRSSNLLSAGKLKGHLLITHGLSDVNVHPQNTVKMTDELIRAGIPFDMMLYPKQTHHFNDEAELHVFQKFVDHFVRYLQPGLGPSGGS